MEPYLLDEELEGFLVGFQGLDKILMNKALEILPLSRTLSFLSKNIIILLQNELQGLFIEVGSGYKDRRIDIPKFRTGL